MVVADFHMGGTFFSLKHLLKIRERISPEGSTFLRCQYSTQSGPGDVLQVDLSLL